MENQSLANQSVHRTLAHSYAAQFIFFLVGVFLDIFFNLKMFSGSTVVVLGYVFLAIGTFLVIWAQKTSRDFKKEKSISRETFAKGPYAYTRNPTQWGLLFATIGFGFTINAFFVVIVSFISFIFTKLVFLNKEEKLLSIKYGEPYLEYKKSVRM